MLNKINRIKLVSIFSFVPFILLLISFSLLNSNIFGQGIDGYYPVTKIKKKDGKWGVQYDREWAIPPNYDKIQIAEYRAVAGKSSVFLAWKADKIDVFHAKWYISTPIISNISAADTIYIPSLAPFIIFQKGIYPVLEGKLFGWKHKQTVIPPQFDSIRPGYDAIYKTHWDEINVFKNGQMGLMSKDGKILIPLGDYEEIGPYLPGHTTVYGKMYKTGERLTGIYLDENKIIRPIYTSLTYETNLNINNILINYTNKEIPGFYSCLLPNGSGDYFIEKDTALVSLPEALASAYDVRRKKEANDKQGAIEALAAKRKWLLGLQLFGTRGAVGIKDSIGNIVLPAQATALDFARFSIDPDDDTIHVTLKSDNIQEVKWAYKGSVPLSEILTQYEDFSKLTIKVELNPYNSLTGNYKSYFDGEIQPGFDYKKGFFINGGVCPLCEGKGKLNDGYNLSSQTFTYDRIVKDGTTSITRKNYLANERVDAYGRVNVPTSTQTFDNYKTFKEQKTVVTKIDKYKTCTLCEGKKNYRNVIISWDDKRSEYVLTSLQF